MLTCVNYTPMGRVGPPKTRVWSPSGGEPGDGICRTGTSPTRVLAEDVRVRVLAYYYTSVLVLLRAPTNTDAGSERRAELAFGPPKWAEQSDQHLV